MSDTTPSPEAPGLTLPGSDAHERKATWLELFFDLVFVAAITAVGSLFAKQADGWGIAMTFALFIPIWWAWVGHTVYSNRFDHNDRLHRVLTGLMMFAAAGMAVQLGHMKEMGGLGFAVAYVAARVCLLILYARESHHPEANDLRRIYLRGFGLGAAFWLVSIFVPPPARYVLWALGMAVELATPWLGRACLQRMPLHVEHLPERMGLFTLILLGEGIVVVVDGMSHESWTYPPLLVASLAFVTAVAIWWRYFSFVEVTPFACRLGSGQPYIYSHLPIALGLTSLAGGIKRAIHEAHEPVFAQPTLVLLGTGAVLWFLGFLLLQWVSYDEAPRTDLLVLGGGAIASVAVVTLGAGLPPVVVAVLLTLVFFGAVLFRHRPHVAT